MALTVNQLPFWLPSTAFVSLVQLVSFSCDWMQPNVILKQINEGNWLWEFLALFFLLFLLHKENCVLWGVC